MTKNPLLVIFCQNDTCPLADRIFFNFLGLKTGCVAIFFKIKKKCFAQISYFSFKRNRVFSKKSASTKIFYLEKHFQFKLDLIKCDWAKKCVLCQKNSVLSKTHFCIKSHLEKIGLLIKKFIVYQKLYFVKFCIFNQR